MSDKSISRTICWFSSGAASAIASKMILSGGRGNIAVVICETGSEHPDNARFLLDCEQWFGVSIIRISSEKYKSTWDVWEKRAYMAGINGAPCTTELKIAPRLIFQRPDDIHVFGYTADAADVARADALRKNYPELKIETPLISAGITKAGCLAMVASAGIKPPLIYELGFPCANCIPCVKATSPNYWSLVRKVFPAEFNRAAALSRQLGAKLTRISGERAFIDQIPDDWLTLDPLVPSCDFLCHIAEDDISKGDGE